MAVTSCGCGVMGITGTTGITGNHWKSKEIKGNHRKSMDHGDHVTVAVVVVVAALCQVRHTSPRPDRHLITKYRETK